MAWIAAMNRPANMSSPRSFVAKIVDRATGIGPRIRKSRSSGKSDSLTSSVMNAMSSIGSAIISMSSPTSARRYGSGDGAIDRIA
jgi:hypothetical protein